MTCHRAISTGLALALCVAAGPAAWAGQPMEQLRASAERVISILEDPKLKAEARAGDRRSALRKAAEEIFDFDETTRRVLGPHWHAIGPEERKEFTALFADLLERSYAARIDQYSGERVAFLGDSIDPNGARAVVKTRFIMRDGTEIPVDYHMLLRDDRWRAYDVRVEGVSLVGNYRSQFDKIIRTGSYEELVRRLRERAGPDVPPARGKRSPRS